MLAAEFLGFRDLRRSHALPEIDPGLVRSLISLCTGENEPRIGLNVIFWNAFAHGVHGAQDHLGDRDTLFGRLSIPERRLSVIFGDALALAVPVTQRHLGERVPLLGRLLVPERGLTIVLGYALATAIADC